MKVLSFIFMVSTLGVSIYKYSVGYEVEGDMYLLVSMAFMIMLQGIVKKSSNIRWLKKLKNEII